ncbi:hypothetical protein HMPREF0645_1946 [Hallella bergensis DSM 17361]|uniref:Uncharacterized protein n=1 Tax=Hallella bergensis DSM 17361 TaxID=585502 RepID=D1PYB1_9BACT|nr:hypothetical protein HMPREF0645_1946 [Hallella bergensis DSM 17361]
MFAVLMSYLFCIFAENSHTNSYVYHITVSTLSSKKFRKHSWNIYEIFAS